MTTDLDATDRPHQPPTGPSDAVDVVVVGSGLAGLTAAATAARAGATVTLVEGPAPDGRARTDERDGFLLNRGPHAVYDRGPGRAVLDRLGLTLDGVDPRRSVSSPGSTTPHPFPRASARSSARSSASPTRPASPRPSPGSPASTRPPSPTSPSTSGSVTCCPSAPRRPRHARPGRHLLRRHRHRLRRRRRAPAEGGGSRGDLPARWMGPAHRRPAGRGPRGARRAGSAVVVGHDGTGPFVRLGGTDDVLRAQRVVVAAGSPTAMAALLPDGAPRAWSALGPAVTATCLDLGLRREPETRSWFGVDRPHYLVAHAPGPGSPPRHRPRARHAQPPPRRDDQRHRAVGRPARAGPPGPGSPRMTW